MWDLFKKKEYKTLEEFEQQERLFEAKLQALREEHQFDIKSLKIRYEAEITILNDTLKFAQANEKSLNAMTGDLAKKIAKLESNYEAFPKKKFNINKAIEVLTKELSDKTLATFLYKLVEALGQSHLDSLENYVNKAKLTIKENGK